MTITKIAIIVGASVITAGSSAAVATRDKWWPGEKTKPSDQNSRSSSDVSVTAKETEAITPGQSGVTTQPHH